MRVHNWKVPNQFIAYSSTVMAVFSLRAAFFIVHDLVQQIEVHGGGRTEVQSDRGFCKWNDSGMT